MTLKEIKRNITIQKSSDKILIQKSCESDSVLLHKDFVKKIISELKNKTEYSDILINQLSLLVENKESKIKNKYAAFGSNN